MAKRTRKIRHLKSQRGMTLVEVLVAVAILSIGLLAIASMQKTAVMVNMRAFDITEAATVAQSQLELLNSSTFNSANLDPGSYSVPNLAPGYDCDWVVTNLTGPSTPPRNGISVRLAVTANGDTTICGNDGTCGSCAGSNGTGSTISCYSVVGVKTAKP